MTPVWQSYSLPWARDLEHPSRSWRMSAAHGRIPKRAPFREPWLGACGGQHNFVGPRKGLQKELPLGIKLWPEGPPKIECLRQPTKWDRPRKGSKRVLMKVLHRSA